MAADNIAMAVYLTAIMIIPAKNIVAAPQNQDFTASNVPDSDSKAAQQHGNSIALPLCLKVCGWL